MGDGRVECCLGHLCTKVGTLHSLVWPARDPPPCAMGSGFFYGSELPSALALSLKLWSIVHFWTDVCPFGVKHCLERSVRTHNMQNVS